MASEVILTEAPSMVLVAIIFYPARSFIFLLLNFWPFLAFILAFGFGR